MIGELPLEIQIKLLRLAPASSLKHVNSHFYMLYNSLYYDKIIETFGEDIIYVIIKALSWIKIYIRSLDAFRFVCRNVIKSRLDLKNVPVARKRAEDCCRDMDPIVANEILNCEYIKDSWRYIYSVLKNKRLFAEYTDYKIDEPTNYVFNHFVEINRSYLLSYTKSLWLAPGDYNLNIGLVIKHGSGLGTTKFEIKYENLQGKTVTQTFYPPTNINEILPKQQFCFLRLGEFTIPPADPKVGTDDCNHHNKLYKVQLVMEEIGLYLKSGFRIFFIDICQPLLLFNDFDLLYYSVKETNYKYFINLPMKNLYKALNYIQNGGENHELNQNDDQAHYGEGDPFDIMDQYDQDYSVDDVLVKSSIPSAPNKDKRPVEKEQNKYKDKRMKMVYGNSKKDHSMANYILNKQKDPREDKLAAYADFYFNNHFKKRYFKFNTVYQRRQFINRFGDFDLDWNNVEEYKPGTRLDDKTSNRQRSCAYDKEGLKWKIPLVGEL